jgi:arabinogalactan endo-1,4-beta-galactosidase
MAVRRIVMAAMAAATLLLVAGPAAAQQYPPLGVQITISDVTPACPGGVMTVSGTGFTPGGEVQIFVESDGILVATTTADETGSFSVTFEVPVSTPGAHTVTAVDVATGEATSAGFVCPAVAVPGLAVTGGNISVWMILLAGLVVVGAAALVAGRRRANRSA